MVLNHAVHLLLVSYLVRGGGPGGLLLGGRNYLAQLVVQSISVVRSELLLSENTLHDGLLVRFANETTPDAEPFVSNGFAAVIRNFLHPLTPLSLLEVAFYF